MDASIKRDEIGYERESAGMLSAWTLEDPAIRIGDRIVYVSHTSPEDSRADVPRRARCKVHSIALGDQTRLVTLIVYIEAGMHETVVSTAPRGEGTVLARGFGHRHQPAILVFRVESGAAFRTA